MQQNPSSASLRAAAILIGGLGFWMAAAPSSNAADDPPPRLTVTTDPAILREQLKRATEEKDTPAALEIQRRLLAANPADADALAALARAQIEAEDYPRARATVEALLKSANGQATPTAKTLAGDLAAAENRPDEALQAWNDALRASYANTDRIGLLSKIAALHEKQVHWAQAADAWTELAKLENTAHRYTGLAVCLINAGRPAESVRAMMTANSLDATDAAVKKELPFYEWLSGQLPYVRSLDARPQNVPTKFARAQFFGCAGAYPPALEIIAPLQEAEPDSAAFRLLKGLVLYKLNRPEEAAKLLVSPLPNPACLDDRTRLDRLRSFDEAIAADPTKGANYSRRAAELLGLDQPALALPDAEQSARLSPKSADAAVIYAAALLRVNRLAEAREQARRAVELEPRNADGWAILGRLEQERAEFPAAIDALSRALTLKEQARWLQRREACLRALGRNAEADKDRRRLEKLPPPTGAS
jgi:tetratricopeptide (TPR) repeat protein